MSSWAQHQPRYAARLGYFEKSVSDTCCGTLLVESVCGYCCSAVLPLLTVPSMVHELVQYALLQHSQFDNRLDACSHEQVF